MYVCSLCYTDTRAQCGPRSLVTKRLRVTVVTPPRYHYALPLRGRGKPCGGAQLEHSVTAKHKVVMPYSRVVSSVNTGKELEVC